MQPELSSKALRGEHLDFVAREHHDVHHDSDDNHHADNDSDVDVDDHHHDDHPASFDGERWRVVAGAVG